MRRPPSSRRAALVAIVSFVFFLQVHSDVSRRDVVQLEIEEFRHIVRFKVRLNLHDPVAPIALPASGGAIPQHQVFFVQGGVGPSLRRDGVTPAPASPRRSQGRARHHSNLSLLQTSLRRAAELLGTVSTAPGGLRRRKLRMYRRPLTPQRHSCRAATVSAGQYSGEPSQTTLRTRKLNSVYIDALLTPLLTELRCRHAWWSLVFRLYIYEPRRQA